ncbi:regulator [Paenibacillus swuensis]|uniref:Regulator n=1 Tax=Paenibacillus swuensis TaxID=1178515 RepID=A0A172TH24_9BACL|nr:response regulator transcription factor [Paenibacillus swuensis]ANE46358.1 regulator [Paenibacillus swuensis]
MNTIRILLVEDDPDWSRAMAMFLNREPDLEIVGIASDRDEALTLFHAADKLDVVLMDINLTGNLPDGIHVAAEMLDIRPLKMIMLTSLEDESVITKAFTAGAVDYVSKTNYKHLPHAIRTAVLHGTPMEALLKEFSRLKKEEQLQALTPAEREVYDLLEQGYTKPQMERKLFKTESTLKNQINKLLKKLGVRSGKEAVEKVRRKGL